MSENYSPDSDAEPQSPYDVAFLSQRDVSLQVPVNYVTAPGVSLTAACFLFGRYESDNYADCLSNLLAVGFRRYELDLYWDQGRRIWSFCPVAIPASIPDTSPSSESVLSLSQSALSALTSDAAPTGTPALSLTDGSSLGARQKSTGAVSSTSVTADYSAMTTSRSSSVTGTSLGDTNSTIAILPNDPNEPLVSIGPYLCTTTINLSTFTSQFLDYIQKTENTLGAHLLYVILNIHAVVSDADPTAPAPAPSNLPGASDSLGGLFSGNLSAYLYTPSNLRSDRANLNASWYGVVDRYRPAEEYYSITLNDNGIASTEDGWPSEGYIEFSKSKRLLLGWGTVDPQMTGYNFSMDASTIFPSDYIQDVQTDISVSSAGRLISGCFLSNTTERLSETNSSWAMKTNLPDFEYPTSALSDITPLLNLATNTTYCGISPILNVNLLNSTAQTNYHPYQNVSYAGGIWSWATAEPKNYSSTDTSSGIYRCATSNLDLQSHWVVADCSQRYYAACRASLQPYNWTITTYPISYSYASQACPDGWSFAAPRTALENSYLGQAMRDSRRDYDGRGAWIDFNSLDVRGCWTTGGPNATCPYTDTLQQEDNLKRVILVPTVAAIIVLVITALTIFVKCAGNRKVRKRVRKRADNGFVYEGVPS